MAPAPELVAQNFPNLIIIALTVITSLIGIAYYIFVYAKRKNEIEISLMVGNISVGIKGDIAYNKAMEIVKNIADILSPDTTSVVPVVSISPAFKDNEDDNQSAASY